MGVIERTRTAGRSLAGGVKRRIDEVRVLRHTDDLLAELGRITYRHHSDRNRPGDTGEIERIVSELRTLEHAGVDVLASGDVETSPDPDPGGSSSDPSA